MTTALRDHGLDARLALLVPFATLAAVMATALLYALVGGMADPRAVLPALYLLTLGGLVAAIFAWPLSLPFSLAAWVLAFTLLRRRSLTEPQVATIAALAAGLAGAAGFALWTSSETATALFLMVLPGSHAGALIAARALYRGAAA